MCLLVDCRDGNCVSLSVFGCPCGVCLVLGSLAAGVYIHHLALLALRFWNYYWKRRLLYWNCFIPATSVSVMAGWMGLVAFAF